MYGPFYIAILTTSILILIPFTVLVPLKADMCQPEILALYKPLVLLHITPNRAYQHYIKNQHYSTGVIEGRILLVFSARSCQNKLHDA